MDARSIALKASMSARGSLEIRLVGGCMEPLLSEGDTALIRPYEQAHVGDICAFQLSSGTLALHRIVSIDKEMIILKGDKSSGIEHIDESDIIGIMDSVRVEGEGEWESMPRGRMRRHVKAWLSRRMYHGEASPQPTLADMPTRLVRRFFRHVLMALNRIDRAEVTSGASKQSRQVPR